MRPALATLAVLLLAAAAANGADGVYYQVNLVPSGKLIATDLPVTRGTMVVFHAYTSGNLVSIRRKDLQSVVRISASAAEGTRPSEAAVPIGNLAMQGAAGPPAAGTRAAASASSANPSAPARWNGYDPWVVTAPGEAPPMALSTPPNAVQSSPGAPPALPP